MPYVVKEDIIAFVQETKNIEQGVGGVYDITLYRDMIGTQLNAIKASVISVAVLNREGKKILMYNNPVVPGVSDSLDIGSTRTGDAGRITFEINTAQSKALDSGDLNIAITLIYSDFYPNAKTYNLPPFKIGQSIASTDPSEPVDPGNGGDNSGGDSVPTPGLFLGSPQFTIEHVDLDMPSNYGSMSINSRNPNQVSKLIFRNLDKNKIRISSLENFLVNRITNEKSNGIITLYNMDDPNFYCIYRIQGWKRLDIVSGNGDSDNTDGVEVSVIIESMSNGPGVHRSSFDIGDNITYTIDTYGIGGSQIPTNGILTYVDKNIQVTKATEGNNSETGVFITHSPYYDSYVMVEVNGISVEVGDNIETASVYFSSNNGISPVEIEAIRAGDQLIWNGDIAGFELEVGDDVNLIYEADVDEIR